VILAAKCDFQPFRQIQDAGVIAKMPLQVARDGLLATGFSLPEARDFAGD
jgi:hypothetical protein